MHDLATQALEVDERFRFTWLAAIASQIRGSADAHLQPPTGPVVESIEEFVNEVAQCGHHGNDALFLMLLSDVYQCQGRVDDARAALEQARAQPRPYAGLVVDLIDERLKRLQNRPRSRSAEAT